MVKTVFLLRHVHRLPDREDEKLIGIYSSLLKAAQAVENAKLLPGFKDHPDGFYTVDYVLDEAEL